MEDCLVRSLGYGVYHVGATAAGVARAAAEQMGTVLELWTDPDAPGSHVAVLGSGFQTSKYEAGVVLDEEISSSVRRSAASSPLGSSIRERLKMVSDACVKILGEAYDRSSLEA